MNHLFFPKGDTISILSEVDSPIAGSRSSLNVTDDSPQYQSQNENEPSTSSDLTVIRRAPAIPRGLNKRPAPTPPPRLVYFMIYVVELQFYLFYFVFFFGSSRPSLQTTDDGTTEPRNVAEVFC